MTVSPHSAAAIAAANPAAPAPVAKLTIRLDGKDLQLRGENRSGTVYVSARDLLSQLGYSVSWEDGQVVAERK